MDNEEKKGILIDEATYVLLLKIQESWGKGLTFKRVPKLTLEWFRKKANEEFEDDYGMCLKFLVDFYQGLIPENEALSNLVERLEMIELRLVELEKKKEENERELIVASDGSILGYKKK